MAAHTSPPKQTRRALISADVEVVMAWLADVVADLRALPAAAQRTPAQRKTARQLRAQRSLARLVLNLPGAIDDTDLGDDA